MDNIDPNAEVMHNSMQNCHQSMDFTREKSVNGDDESKDVMRAKLLTVPEACEFLRIGRHRLYKLINSRELISMKNGLRRLISVGAILDYIYHEEHKYET